MENNEQTTQQPSETAIANKIDLPNATIVLVLGILSIILCSFIGLVLGIIALVYANKDIDKYNNNTNLYTKESYNNIKTGKICAIIGICLSSLAILFLVFYFIFILGIIGSIVHFISINKF